MELTKEYFDQKLVEINEKYGNFDSRLSILTDIVLANQEDFSILKKDIKEIKEIVIRVDKRDLEDSNAFRTMLLDHGIRIKKLEKMAHSH